MKIEFLEGGSPDCPLVRIYGTERAGFAAFHELVRLVARGTGGGCSTIELADLTAISDCVLDLEISPTDMGVRRGQEHQRFFWMMTPKAWSIVAGLVHPFAKESVPGTHQWLCGPEARYGLEVGSISILLSCSNDGSW
jgi:hypothetical protein